jgi:hypothetical protein
LVKSKFVVKFKFVCQSPLDIHSHCSISTDPISRISELSLGEMTITLERRFSSLLSRSMWLKVRLCFRIPVGKCHTVHSAFKVLIQTGHNFFNNVLIICDYLAAPDSGFL